MSKLKFFSLTIFCVIVHTCTLHAKTDGDSYSTRKIINLAEVTVRDSSASVKTAIYDVNKYFYVRKADLKKLIASHYPPNSDYYKPNVATMTDYSYLSDSVYVQTYRAQAFLKLTQPDAYAKKLKAQGFKKGLSGFSIFLLFIGALSLLGIIIYFINFNNNFFKR